MSYMPFIVGYVLIVAILLWYLARSGRYIFNRIMATIITVGYGIILISILPSIMGWPVKVNNMPNKTQIITYRIQEPTPLQKGYIYFWTVLKAEDPRGYKVPYSKELHKKLLEMSKQVKRGGRLIVDKTEGKSKTGKVSAGGLHSDSDVSFKIVAPETLLMKSGCEASCPIPGR